MFFFVLEAESDNYICTIFSKKGKWFFFFFFLKISIKKMQEQKRIVSRRLQHIYNQTIDPRIYLYSV